MAKKVGLVTSLYCHDIILVLFQCIIKQDNIATGDLSQSTPKIG